MNDTKSAAAHHPWPHGVETPVETTAHPDRHQVWRLLATIVGAILGFVVGVAWTTAAPSATPTPQPLAPACADALDHARTISAHARYDWVEAQTWVNVGAMGQYADQRADAEAIARKTDATISAREDLLERAQTQFVTALKGCNA
jgi:hypothetical protein